MTVNSKAKKKFIQQTANDKRSNLNKSSFFSKSVKAIFGTFSNANNDTSFSPLCLVQSLWVKLHLANQDIYFHILFLCNCTRVALHVKTEHYL